MHDNIDALERRTAWKSFFKRDIYFYPLFCIPVLILFWKLCHSLPSLFPISNYSHHPPLNCDWETRARCIILSIQRIALLYFQYYYPSHSFQILAICLLLNCSHRKIRNLYCAVHNSSKSIFWMVTVNLEARSVAEWFKLFLPLLINLVFLSSLKSLILLPLIRLHEHKNRENVHSCIILRKKALKTI